MPRHLCPPAQRIETAGEGCGQQPAVDRVSAGDGDCTGGHADGDGSDVPLAGSD